MDYIVTTPMFLLTQVSADPISAVLTGTRDQHVSAIYTADVVAQTTVDPTAGDALPPRGVVKLTLKPHVILNQIQGESTRCDIDVSTICCSVQNCLQVPTWYRP